MINPLPMGAFRNFLVNHLDQVSVQESLMISLPRFFRTTQQTYEICLLTCRTDEINGHLVAILDVEFQNVSDTQKKNLQHTG